MIGNGVRVAALVLAVAGTVALGGCSGGGEALELLAADGKVSDDGLAIGTRKLGEPYRVGGRWYTPQHDPEYDETGRASWYGPKFHGKRTANGERFDEGALTAAHPTLPLPSYVRVTVLKTGKAAVLRVNDRGPFKDGRIIDVSRKAAEELGFRRAGQAKVRVEYLGEAELGGGDRERLVAAAKYGTKSSGGSVRDYLPFGLGRPRDEREGEIEVRLASAEPLQAVAATTPPSEGESSGLPGVAAPQAYVPPLAAGPAQAFAEEKAPDGALTALAALSQEADAPPLSLEVEPVVAEPVEALSEEVVAASKDRVMGAFDVFAVAPPAAEDGLQPAPATQ
ncbi:septal ring lytic transglycosylase RlpA family protein [Acuticoccus sp.]|uniref:septal ring lytic transglycosylase RlpA family protein n=1 Tax=Acuticoccus sp. TaxID=1904378 RepID=UPI003B51F354